MERCLSVLTYHLQILTVTNLLFIKELSPYTWSEFKAPTSRWHVGIKIHEKIYIYQRIKK